MKYLLLLLSLVLVSTATAAPAPALLKNLKTLPENRVGYDRDLFQHWIDADGNGCDTRDEVLFRQNLNPKKICGDKTGKWVSAYDGKTVVVSSDLDVDHFVPLAEAWDSGARLWDSRTRTRFANDLYRASLVAVSASSNRSKSDSDPSEWLPRKSFVCRYSALWVSVKYRWSLSVDVTERRTLVRIFSKCSRASIQLPSIAKAPVVSSPIPKPNPKLDPQFSSCSKAVAAGYGPYVRGRDPEYYWYRDADSDGTVCE